LSFLFGMSAEDAMSRYELNLRYLQGGKPDPNYHYIHVVPKSQKDKIDFREAYLTLYRANNLPAQIRYTHANNNVIEWNFTKVQINVNIPADKYFVPEDMPGWRTERVKPILPQAGPAVRPTSK
jgi:outer membrane lipoprotein-sorting protein